MAPFISAAAGFEHMSRPAHRSHDGMIVRQAGEFKVRSSSDRYAPTLTSPSARKDAPPCERWGGVVMNLDKYPRFAAIMRLLWEEWDPLDLNGIAPKDEYDKYAMGAWSLLEKGASADDIAAYLLSAEHEDMELERSDKTDQRAKLIAQRAVTL